MNPRLPIFAAALTLVTVSLVSLSESPAVATTSSGPNGLIAYSLSAEGPTPVRTINSDGSGFGSAGCAADTTDFLPAWSPDGEKLAFNCTALNSDQHSVDGFYVANADGSSPVKISAVRESPDWSPDGSSFLYVSDSDHEVHRMTVAGSEQGQQTASGGQKFSPKWSPDGSGRMAYSKGGPSWNTNGDIFLKAPAADPVQLTTNPADDQMGSWSPDGSQIVFSSNRSGNYELYIIGATPGSTAHRLTTTSANEKSPAWSPDGRKIAYAREETGNPGQADIWSLVVADPGTATQLTDDVATYPGGASASGPAWAPLICLGKKPTIVGTAASETIHGTPGDDVIAGLGGEDLILGQGGADRLCGGRGIDTVSYADHFEPVEASLSSTTSDAGSTEDGTAGSRDAISADVENLTGSPANDVLKGDDGANVIKGRGGDDALDGRLGTDVIAGGTGRDAVYYTGRTSPITVILDNLANDGEAGEHDTVKSSVEDLFGGDNADTLIGSLADNHLTGGGGDDTLRGRGGNDELVGVFGNDLLFGGRGDDTLTGGFGNDTADGQSGIDSCSAEQETNCES